MVEVGESGGGITGGPASEGGGHVAFWGILSVRDGFLAGDGTPGIVKFTKFGGVLWEMCDLLAHEAGVFGGEVLEHFREGEAALDGSFCHAEYFAKFCDVSVGE